MKPAIRLAVVLFVTMLLVSKPQARTAEMCGPDNCAYDLSTEIVADENYCEGYGFYPDCHAYISSNGCYYDQDGCYTGYYVNFEYCYGSCGGY